MPRNAKFILRTARMSFFLNLKTIVFVRIDYLSVTGNSAHARLILLSTKNTSYNDLANKSLQGTGQCLSEALCCISIGNLQFLIQSYLHHLVEETICFLNIPFCEFYSVSFVPSAIDMILTKLDKSYVLD